MMKKNLTRCERLKGAIHLTLLRSRRHNSIPNNKLLSNHDTECRPLVHAVPLFAQRRCYVTLRISLKFNDIQTDKLERCLDDRTLDRVISNALNQGRSLLSI